MREAELHCIDCMKEGKEVEADYFVWFIGYSGIYTYLCAHHLTERIKDPGDSPIYQITNIRESRRLMEARRKKR